MMSLKQKTKKTWLLSLLSFCVLSVSLAYAWLRQPYTYPAAQEVTHQFMQLLRQQHYAEAFNLMAKPNLIGDTPQALAERAQSECLDDQNFMSASPPQTRGNRLRRWFKNQPLDQTKINLEFAHHTCLLGVQLLKNKQGEWRILRFGLHAG
ncbi:hypothetical protein [uncultured Thiothrix sp.]|uniref:hypothetical protein n=1 Tax=uncultured Thiothrix sp. TaxID=223185 RepID=UPI00260956E8|nr:hypothetical protein [uncultured Thiothrix sp.]